MAAPTVRSFKLRFPEFSGVDDPTIEFWLGDVDSELSETAFGEHYNKAVETLAAHELALSNQRAANAQTDESGKVQTQPQGTVVSASADGLSVSLAAPKAATGTNREAYLSQTPYGTAYLSLRARCLRRARVA